MTASQELIVLMLGITTCMPVIDILVALDNRRGRWRLKDLWNDASCSTITLGTMCITVWIELIIRII